MSHMGSEPSLNSKFVTNVRIFASNEEIMPCLNLDGTLTKTPFRLFLFESTMFMIYVYSQQVHTIMCILFSLASIGIHEKSVSRAAGPQQSRSE